MDFTCVLYSIEYPPFYVTFICIFRVTVHHNMFIQLVIAISYVVLGSVNGGLIYPVPPFPPPLQFVPFVPIVGIFELFGPVQFGGMAGLPTRPPPMPSPLGMLGKYGGLPYSNNEFMGNPGVYGMSMHNFMPKVGHYQYYQYNYDPRWSSYMYGKCTVSL